MSSDTAMIVSDVHYEGICCGVCGNTNPDNFQPAYNFKDFVVVRCDTCSFHFIPPYFRKNISYEQYKNSDVAAAVRAGNDWIKVERHKQRLRFVRKYIRKGKLFDLGAGWGHFMMAANELGFEAEGIEMSEQQARYCALDKKLKVTQGDFFQMDESKKFDVITLWDVLEHIDKPGEMLIKCNRMTNDNGYLFIHVPQIDSLFARMHKENWKMMGLDHVNYFSRNTITRILEKNGYETVAIRSSFEFKLFVMYTLLPLLKKMRSSKKQSLREANAGISSAERQRYFNKITSLPRWLLKIILFLHNRALELFSFFRLGEEMVVAARKVRSVK
jgi:2-polyprenyl-3-methyl-5-hydroxy-6-metoxy-1,4-benzoquinol methylase